MQVLMALLSNYTHDVHHCHPPLPTPLELFPVSNYMLPIPNSALIQHQTDILKKHKSYFDTFLFEPSMVVAIPLKIQLN